MDYSTGVLRSMAPPFFPALRQSLGPYLVDKTMLIESVVVSGNLNGYVDLVLRPRRCGKSTMLQMLKSFFSVTRDGDDPAPEQLFDGLNIAKFRQDICDAHMGKYPVVFIDFKDISGESWEQMLSIFKSNVSTLYREWKDCLLPSLEPEDKTYFESICHETATNADLTASLFKLTGFLVRKFNQKVIVLIDEYDAPNNQAYDHGYFDKANYFFGRQVLPRLLKSNKNLRYAVLAGVTPTAKSGWYSGLNNLDIHALHTRHSIFAGMLMFKEFEVENLIALSDSNLELEDLRVHYNSYFATDSTGLISLYNPVSIMSALSKSSIEKFWVATGEYPLLKREFPDDGLNDFEKLLEFKEIDFELVDDVTYSNSTLSQVETLTLLYYAGYLTMTVNGHFKIPNLEVMSDWARWIVDGIESRGDSRIILRMCVEGPITDFEKKWSNFMQQVLDPKLVAKEQKKKSHKTPERVYHVFFLGLMQSLGAKGWEVNAEARAGSGYVDLRLLHRQKHEAVLIELKSSEKKDAMDRDADMALEQIVVNNYRNPVGLANIRTLREYGIACFKLESIVKGRYLTLSGQQWEEKEDPAMSVL